MLDSGVLIDERHEIEQLLGTGGMAEVFRARDTTTGQRVAIKLLRTVDPQSMGRYRSEIDVLSRLDHSGVVRLRGTGCHDGPLGVDRSISIGRQLAAALAHAHQLDVVHRDLKPANVIFDADLTRVRLADFGIALLNDTTRITAAGQCIGTAAYLTPEQLQGQVGRPLAGAVADAFRRESVEPILVCTAEVDQAVPPPAPPGAGASRHRLLLAFGSGALTSAVVLAILALTLTIGPLR